MKTVCGIGIEVSQGGSFPSFYCINGTPVTERDMLHSVKSDINVIKKKWFLISGKRKYPDDLCGNKTKPDVSLVFNTYLNAGLVLNIIKDFPQIFSSLKKLVLFCRRQNHVL